MSETAALQRLAPGELLTLAHTYRLSFDVTSARGTIGSKQGRETGASVEIQDFRDYVPGDDPRRIDWMAYGRTDRLVVRLFREEVSPFVDLVIDSSASMALRDGRKHALAADLAAWLYHSARAQAMPVRLYAAGTQVQRLENPDQLRFEEPECVLFTAPHRAAGALRRSSVRVLLTDFMAPADPATSLRTLSAGCGMLVLIHLLGPWEADPRTEGPAVLQGVETGRQVDIHLDHKTVDGYRRRLRALITVLREEMFKCGGQYVGLVADRGLEHVLKHILLPMGLAETD